LIIVCVVRLNSVASVSSAWPGKLWCYARSYIQAGTRTYRQPLWVLQDCIAARDGMACTS